MPKPFHASPCASIHTQHYTHHHHRRFITTCTRQCSRTTAWMNVTPNRTHTHRHLADLVKLRMHITDIRDGFQAFQGVPHHNASLADSTVASAGCHVVPYIWRVNLFSLGDILKGFLDLQNSQAAVTVTVAGKVKRTSAVSRQSRQSCLLPKAHDLLPPKACFRFAGSTGIHLMGDRLFVPIEASNKQQVGLQHGEVQLCKVCCTVLCWLAIRTDTSMKSEEVTSLFTLVSVFI